jgi:caffeoyl-CoA O-methyltransferase
MNDITLLHKIEFQAQANHWPIMGPLKGKVLEYFVKRQQPRNVLEIGTLVGYSAILIARNLPKEGKITTVDVDPQIINNAQDNFLQAGIADRVKIRIGDALDVIPSLKGPFNLVFIDADKASYLRYLQLIEPQLTSGSVVIADNIGIFKETVQDYLNYVQNSNKYTSMACDYGFDAVEVSRKIH